MVESEEPEHIREFIAANHDTELITQIGGNGLAAVYNFSNDGPVVVIRCEPDAANRSRFTRNIAGNSLKL